MFPPNWTTTGAEWDSKAATATSAFVTRAASTGPASSRGSATVRRAGGDSSATKVRRENPVTSDEETRRGKEPDSTDRVTCWSKDGKSWLLS